MTSTIAAVMRHTRNYFEPLRFDGEITISGGVVVSPDLRAPYVYIKGSTFHDGLWEMAGPSLVRDNWPAETFTGTAWLISPPQDFLALCQQIHAYETNTPVGALMSESLEGYSYTRQSNGRGGVMTWEDAFAARLAPYRRMFTEVG